MDKHLYPLVSGPTLLAPKFPASMVLNRPWLGCPYPWPVNLYEPPSAPADVKLWSEGHLYCLIAAPLVARAILPNGHRAGRLYRAGPYVLALGRSLVPEFGCELARGEWVRLDTGARGKNLLELYAHEHFRPYCDAVMALGRRAGLVGSDGAVRRLHNLRHWSQELQPLHRDDLAYFVDLGYPPGSAMLPYRNAVGHAIAQVVRVPPRLAPPLDLYRSLWRHGRGTETQWIEAFPRPPYPLFNADQIFGRPKADIIFVANEFVASELGGRCRDRVFSTMPGGLENLPRADLTSLRARRVGVVLWLKDMPQGRRIEAALRGAGVADAFFLLGVRNVAHSFADLAAVAEAEGLNLLPVHDGDQPVPGTVVVWEAGQPIPDVVVERRMIIHPIVRAGDLVWIYGDPKIGKTWLAHALALLASVGAGAVGPWTAVEPTRVLYVDGEMHAADLKRNITMLMKGADNVTPGSDNLPFDVLIAKEQPDGVIDIAHPDWQDRIETLLVGRTVLILDNFQSLTDNGPAALKAIHPWLRRLSRAGIAVIIMDHTNRDGELQGSIMKERIADLSIVLRYASDADRAAGIMTVEFSVARRLYGTDVQPVRMQRVFTPDTFAFRLLDLKPTSGPELSPTAVARLDRMARVVVARQYQGLTFEAIDAQYGIRPSTAHGLVQAALTLTGAERAHFQTECDRLRGTLDRPF
jgi:hypothetical protein